jgi:peptidoglycan-associated lipoprotein
MQKATIIRAARWLALPIGFAILAGLPHANAQREDVDGTAGQLEVAATYSVAQGNRIPGSTLWMQGGSLEIVGYLPHGVAAVACVSGLHNGPGSTGVPLSLVVEAFGPRVAFPLTHINALLRKRTSAFGQALIGEAHGLQSEFPDRLTASSTASGFALRVGGGIDIVLSQHFALRAVEANWLRTQLPNSTTNVQNDLQLSTGIVFRSDGASHRSH